MAYKRRYGGEQSGFNLNTALQNPEFQKILLSKAGVDASTPEPKANFLSRLLAMPSAIGSIPDVIYQAQQGKNPLTAYLGNLSKGLTQTVTGKKVLDTKTTSDLLKKNKILAGSDIGSKIGRGVLGFIGDVALDPTTYLTLGTGKLAVEGAKVAGEGIMKKLGKEGIEKLGASGAIDLTELLAKQGVPAATKFLKEKGVNLAEDVVRNATANVAKNTSLKFAGNEILEESPEILKRGVSAIVNPLGGVLDVAGAAGRKFAPEATQAVSDTFNQLFNKRGFAASKNLGGLADIASTSEKATQGIVRSALAENDKLLQRVYGLPEELQSNLGQYIEGTLPVPAQIADIVSEVKNLTKAQGEKLTQSGILKGAVENYFPRKAIGMTEQGLRDRFGAEADLILREPTVQKDLKDGLISFKSLTEYGNKNPTSMQRIQGIMDAENYLKGAGKERTYETMAKGIEKGIVYDKNAARTLAESIIGSEQALQAKQLQAQISQATDDVGNKLVRTADEFGSVGIPKNYTQLDVKGMEGMYVPKEAASVLKNYTNNFFGDEGTGKIMKAYDGFLKLFKRSVTGSVFNPGVIGYNVRNAIGDFSNMLVGGFGLRGGVLNPSEVGSSLKRGFDTIGFENLMKKEGKEVAIKKYGNDVADLYEQAVKKGIVGGGVGQLEDEFGKAVTGFEQPSIAKTIGDKARKIEKKLQAPVTAISGAREDGMRIANFYDHYKQTGNWDEAARLARASSLDYGNLTAFEKNVMKRIVPFYSFMRQNMEHQLSTLAKNPGRIMTQQKALRSIGDTLSTDSMTEEDWAVLPDWMKTGLSVATGKRGNVVDILTGFGDPTTAINDLVGTTPKETLQNVFQSMSPLLKIPIEQATGKSLFSGKDLTELTDGRRYKNAPQFMKDFLGYKEIKGKNSNGEVYINYKVSPEKAYFLDNAPFIAPFNTFAKRLGELPIGNKDGDWKYLTNLLSGGRIYQKDLTREQAIKTRTEQERLNKILIDSGLANPQTGIYLNNMLQENSPAVLEMLKSLGYSPKVKTTQQVEKTNTKADENRAYIEKLLQQGGL